MAEIPQRTRLKAISREENQPASAIDVAAGLVFRDGKLLIAQRRRGDHLGGLWEFPGGKREPNETFQECLRRELKEELGIDAEPGELIEAITHVYPEKTVHLRFYSCRCQTGAPQSLGCDGFAWVTLADLPRYAFPAADQMLLQILRSRADLWV